MTPRKHWAVVPAGGKGLRMGTQAPKQYLPLRGRPVIEHTLRRLCGHPQISGVVAAIAADDEQWNTLQIGERLGVLRAPGGRERCHSVANALAVLEGRSSADDWVLVHDAVRPCLRASDIDRLIEELRAHPVGGLLGTPVKDTMKRTDAEATVIETVDRNALWHALTPQMFRFGLLAEALAAADRADVQVTDEAQAVELAGFRPQMVEGGADNIKITRPQDLALAELFLASQEKES